MNLNRKIETIRGDGIPGYNRKINEIIGALNWLMGVRAINGRPISESDQGPVFDLSQANMTQGQALDAFDPDGNKAGWSLITCLNLQTNQSFQVWIWTGQVPQNIQNIPWAFDPSNNQAGWIVCPTHANWGTGQCADAGTACINFKNAIIHTVDNYVTITANPGTIVPPSSCTPRFYFITRQTIVPTPAAPTIEIGQAVPSGAGTVSFTYSLTITYDGVQVFSLSGSGSASYGDPNTISIPVNPAGWVFDPSGLPGYSHGSGAWTYQFNGPASTNTNPIIVFKWNISSGFITGGYWDVVFMQGS